MGGAGFGGRLRSRAQSRQDTAWACRAPLLVANEVPGYCCGISSQILVLRIIMHLFEGMETMYMNIQTNQLLGEHLNKQRRVSELRHDWKLVRRGQRVIESLMMGHMKISIKP